MTDRLRTDALTRCSRSRSPPRSSSSSRSATSPGARARDVAGAAGDHPPARLAPPGAARGRAARSRRPPRCRRLLGGGAVRGRTAADRRDRSPARSPSTRSARTRGTAGRRCGLAPGIAGLWATSCSPPARRRSRASSSPPGSSRRRRGSPAASPARALRRALDASAQRARAAASEERQRIARELHDVVAHGVVLMVLQAQGARRILDHDPARARDALEAIEETGQTALEEIRALARDPAGRARARRPGAAAERSTTWPR